MPTMASSFILLLSLLLPIIALCFFIYVQKSGRTSSGRLPPGPRPLPIIGNLHLLSPLPHRDVAKLSKTYGGILYLRLGSVPTIFISSPLIAQHVFKSHDIIFSNRPPSEAFKIVSYGHKSSGFAEYGPYWRHVRKLSITNLFTSAKLDSHEFIRKEEIINFVQSLKEAAQARAMVDVTARVRVLVADIVCRIVMGRKCMDESMDGAKISEHIEEVMRVLGSFNLNDALPFLRLFDLQGIRRRTRAVMQPIDKFLEKIIDEHVQLREIKGKKKKQQQQQKDYVDVLLDSMNGNGLDLELDRTSIKAIILETFTGTLDTSPDAIDWALVELLRHPTVMRKVREELVRVVGRHRTVEESDLPKLPYLALVIKESFRLHELIPFIFRHTKEDVVLDGYNIAGGSNIMVCIWAMARDPDLWHDPEEFIPERFENSSIDIKGHDFQPLPFGSGRRICPGMSFGLLVVPLVLAQLVHCFDWELPDGLSPSELVMKESYGLTMPRVNHLNATPIYSLVDNHV